MLGDPRHRVDKRDITVETEAAFLFVSGVDDGSVCGAAGPEELL